MFKKFFEKQHLIIERVGPILIVVSAGAYNKVVVYALVEQFLVQLFVDTEKEVALATVDNDGQIVVCDTVKVVHYDVAVPNLLMGLFLAKFVLDEPLVREGPEVDTATHAAACAKDVFVAESGKQCAVASHA